MANNKFSTTWKRSTQPRKQRSYRYTSPLHIKQKLMHVHLSPVLRKKYGTRNVQLRKGDKVKILRGTFSKKEGKVDRILLQREKVYVVGIEQIKKDSGKVPFPLNPTNLMIVDLNLDDKKRRQKIENKISASKGNNETKKEPTEVKQSKDSSNDNNKENKELKNHIDRVGRLLPHV